MYDTRQPTNHSRESKHNINEMSKTIKFISIVSIVLIVFGLLIFATTKTLKDAYTVTTDTGEQSIFLFDDDDTGLWYQRTGVIVPIIVERIGTRAFYITMEDSTHKMSYINGCWQLSYRNSILSYKK